MRCVLGEGAPSLVNQGHPPNFSSKVSFNFTVECCDIYPRHFEGDPPNTRVSPWRGLLIEI